MATAVEAKPLDQAVVDDLTWLAHVVGNPIRIKIIALFIENRPFVYLSTEEVAALIDEDEREVGEHMLALNLAGVMPQAGGTYENRGMIHFRNALDTGKFRRRNRLI